MVDIFAPPDAKRLKVHQVGDTDGRGLPVVTVNPGVELQTLVVKGGGIGCTIDGASVRSLLSLKTGRGEIRVTDSDVAAASLAADNNNVFFLTPDNASYHAAVNYRSTSNFGCFSTVRGGEIEIAEPWEQCLLETSPTFSSHARKLVKQYDADRNFRISADELNTGMKELGMCCGPGCPLYSRCRQMHVETYVPFGTTYSSAAAFVDAVRDENQTTFVPACHRRATIRSAGSTDY